MSALIASRKSTRERPLCTRRRKIFYVLGVKRSNWKL